MQRRTRHLQTLFFSHWLKCFMIFFKRKSQWDAKSKSTSDILQTKSKNIEWKTAIKRSSEESSKRVFYSNCHLLLTTRKRWWRTSHLLLLGFLTRRSRSLGLCTRAICKLCLLSRHQPGKVILRKKKPGSRGKGIFIDFFCFSKDKTLVGFIFWNNLLIKRFSPLTLVMGFWKARRIVSDSYSIHLGKLSDYETWKNCPDLIAVNGLKV